MGKRIIPDQTKAEYLEWLLTPPQEREVKTKTEMAERLDVHLSTLYSWENSDEFQGQMRQIKTKWGTRFIPDILGRLMDIVKDGSNNEAINASKVLLPHLDASGEKGESKTPDPDRIKALKEALRSEGLNVSDD